MSKILVITPVPTHPPDAGNRARIHTMLGALESAGHTVVLMHIEREQGDKLAMRAHFQERYLPVPYTQTCSTAQKRWRRWQQRLGKAIGQPLGYTYKLDAWWDDSATAQVHAAIEAFDIDAVLVNYVFFSKALVGLPAGVLGLLDTHDSFANRHKRLLAAGLEPAWFACTPAAEETGVNRADVVIAIQTAEAQYFRTLTSKPVVTVGHLVESPPAPIDIPLNKRILSIGSRNTINVDSNRWLAQKVLPLVRQSVSEATLVIAGSVCDDLQELRDQPGVELAGRVDSLAAEYQNANLVVNPMLAGTGLKIKSIEAMGLGCALVTTDSGAQGLDDGLGHAFMQANGPEQMSEAVIKLLKNAEQTRLLGAQAHAFARAYNANCLAALSAALSENQPQPLAEAS